MKKGVLLHLNIERLSIALVINFMTSVRLVFVRSRKCGMDIVSSVSFQQGMKAVSSEKREVTNQTTFAKAYETQQKSTETLDDIFEEAAQKYQVDVNLLKAIGKAESDFRPNITSHAGAMGIMQIMPATAREYGVTNPYDPRQNIMAGAREISELLQKYNGDLELSLAGYNAGMGNVAKYGGVPPFRETRNYIKKVTEYLKTPIHTGKTVPVVNNGSQVETTDNNSVISDTTLTASSINEAGMLNFISFVPITYGQSIAKQSMTKVANSAVSTIEYQSLMKYMIESLALNLGRTVDNSEEKLI